MPRLSKVNLFTLFSLWMELFPSAEQQKKSQVKGLHLPLISLSEHMLIVHVVNLNQLLFTWQIVRGGGILINVFQIFLRTRKKIYWWEEKSKMVK